MINLYEDSIEPLHTIMYDKDMLTEIVYAYREQNGQYFCVTYQYSTKEFKDFTTSGNEIFSLGDILRCFKNSSQPQFLERIIKMNKKRKYFRNSDKIRFFFTYNGRLSLVDVWTEKEQYIGPKEFNEFFCLQPYIDSSELIFSGILDYNFIKANPGIIIRRKNGTKVRL